MSVEMGLEVTEPPPSPTSPMLVDAELSAEEAQGASQPNSPVSPQAESPTHGTSAADGKVEKRKKTKEEREMEKAEREKRRKEREERERHRLFEKAERERQRKEKEEQREKEKEDRKRKLEEEREQKERREKEKEKEREEKKRRLDEEKEEKKRRLDEEKERKEKERIEKLKQKEKERQEKEDLRKEEERRKEEEKLRLEVKQKKMEITNFVVVTKKDSKDDQGADRAGSTLGPFASYEPCSDVAFATVLRSPSLELSSILGRLQPEAHPSHTPTSTSACEIPSSSSTLRGTASEAGRFWASLELLGHWRQLPKASATRPPAVPGELPPDFHSNCKVLSLHDSGRPAYFGTFQKKSTVLNGRNPSTSASDPHVDYENFSEDEWEEEPADGEDVDDDRKSDVDVEDAEDEDAEDWCVEDDYFSEDEGLFRSGDEAEGAAPGNTEENTELEREGPKGLRRRLKRRSKQPLGVVPPRVIGPIWSSDLGDCHPLGRFRAVNVWQAKGREDLKCPLAALISARQVGKNGERELMKQDKTPRKVVQERHMIDLVKLVHGATKLETAVKQFVEKFPEECSKAQTEAKMREICAREKVGKYLRWMVRPEVLSQHAPDFKPNFDDDDSGSPAKPELKALDPNVSPQIAKLTPKSKLGGRKPQTAPETCAGKENREVEWSSPEADRQLSKQEHAVSCSLPTSCEGCSGEPFLVSPFGPGRPQHAGPDDPLYHPLQPLKMCFEEGVEDLRAPSLLSPLLPMVTNQVAKTSATVLIPRRKSPS